MKPCSYSLSLLNICQEKKVKEGQVEDRGHSVEARVVLQRYLQFFRNDNGKKTDLPFSFLLHKIFIEYSELI